MKFNISIYDKLQVETLLFHLMSTDSNSIDILLKNYWFENRSFCIMREGIIRKFHIAHLSTSSTLPLSHQATQQLAATIDRPIWQLNCLI